MITIPFAMIPASFVADVLGVLVKDFGDAPRTRVAALMEKLGLLRFEIADATDIPVDRATKPVFRLKIEAEDFARQLAPTLRAEGWEVYELDHVSFPDDGSPPHVTKFALPIIRDGRVVPNTYCAPCGCWHAPGARWCAEVIPASRRAAPPAPPAAAALPPPTPSPRRTAP